MAAAATSAVVFHTICSLATSSASSFSCRSLAALGLDFRQWTLNESYLAWALPSFSWRLRHVFPRFSNSHFVWRRNSYFSRDSRSYFLKLFGIFITKSVRNLVNRSVDNSMHHEGGSLSNDLRKSCDHLGNLSLKGFHL